MLYQGKNLSVTVDENNCAELCFDVQDSAVNIFNQQTVADLAAALAVLKSSVSVKGLLITSAKPAFIAGADVMAFAPAFAFPRTCRGAVVDSGSGSGSSLLLGEILQPLAELRGSLRGLDLGVGG